MKMATLKEMADTFEQVIDEHGTSYEDAIRAVIEKHIGPLLEEAFVAGFLVSGEGWNGEYPHDFTDGETLRKELLAPSSEFIARIISDLTANPPTPEKERT